MRTSVSACAKKHGRAFAVVPLLALLCLLCQPHAAAQDASPVSTAGGAAKFDEYGRIGSCDHGARLDNFANELQANPETTGYIVGYDAAKGSPGLAKGWIEIARAYLVNTRDLDAARLVTISAGRHQGAELKTELWVVPRGAEAPASASREEDEPPFSGVFAKMPVWSDGVFNEVDELGGPSFSPEVTFRAFADVLRRQPKSKGYLVAYTDDESAPGAWLRFATREKARLEVAGAARLTIINGGRRKENEIDLWIVPEDAPPPVKARKREKPLKEAVLIGTFTRYEWSEEAENAGERKWLLSNFAEMLRADPQRVGVLVVFQDGAPARLSEGDGELTEAFDYARLAGEWKQELAAGYGIEAHRVVLRIGLASDSQSSCIETWIVPKGVALPDPAQIVKQREAELSAEPEPDGEDKPWALEAVTDG